MTTQERYISEHRTRDRTCTQKQKLLSMLAEGLTLCNIEKPVWALLLKDASHPGKFRYQLFDINGFGRHYTFPSLEDAFNAAFSSGFCCVDMGAMERIFGTDKWRRGMQNG